MTKPILKRKWKIKKKKIANSNDPIILKEDYFSLAYFYGNADNTLVAASTSLCFNADILENEEENNIKIKDKKDDGSEGEKISGKKLIENIENYIPKYI